MTDSNYINRLILERNAAEAQADRYQERLWAMRGTGLIFFLMGLALGVLVGIAWSFIQ